MVRILNSFTHRCVCIFVFLYFCCPNTTWQHTLLNSCIFGVRTQFFHNGIIYAVSLPISAESRHSHSRINTHNGVSRRHVGFRGRHRWSVITSNCVDSSTVSDICYLRSLPGRRSVTAVQQILISGIVALSICHSGSTDSDIRRFAILVLASICANSPSDSDILHCRDINRSESLIRSVSTVL